MLESTKVVAAMAKMYVLGSKTRKEYRYGNDKHDVRTSREKIYSLMQQLTKDMIKGANMELVVKGEEHLPQQGPVLYVANHSSIFDVVTLGYVIKEPCIFIGKKEVSKMPLINVWFDALGCIYIDREDKRQSLECILKGINELKSGQSIILFPEGTRTMGDEMKPFKEGSFKLATKSGVPIVPIALRNTHKVFEENKRIKKAKVQVNIGPMIETKNLDKEGQQKLPKQVEACVRDLLQELIEQEK